MDAQFMKRVFVKVVLISYIMVLNKASYDYLSHQMKSKRPRSNLIQLIPGL